MNRRDLKDLERLTRGIPLKLARPDALGQGGLEDLTRSLHSAFATLEELLLSLNTLSLERHSQDKEAELEATFSELGKRRSDGHFRRAGFPGRECTPSRGCSRPSNTIVQLLEVLPWGGLSKHEAFCGYWPPYRSRFYNLGLG